MTREEQEGVAFVLAILLAWMLWTTGIAHRLSFFDLIALAAAIVGIPYLLYLGLRQPDRRAVAAQYAFTLLRWIARINRALLLYGVRLLRRWLARQRKPRRVLVIREFGHE